MCGRLARRFVLGVLFVCGSVSHARAGRYSWTTAGPEPGEVFQIVVDPANSDSLFTVGGFWGGYVFRTNDRGSRWDYVEGSPGVGYLVPDPSRSGVLYASAGPSGVWITVNGGRSWRAVSVGGYAVGTVAVAPSSPANLYALTQTAPVHAYRSTDSGATWTFAGDLPAIGRLTVDPSNPMVLYAAAYPALLKSTDGGATWNPSNTGLPSSANLVRIDPTSPSRVYAATADSGVYVSTDAGASWDPSNTGLEWQDVRDLAIDPLNPARLFAASAGSNSPPALGGIFLSTDSGANWTPVDLVIPGLVFGTAVTIDPRDSNLVYAGVGASTLRGNVIKSADGGATWVLANEGLSGYLAYGAAPRTDVPAGAVGISGNHVYGTPDNGHIWNLLASTQFFLTSVIADPSDPATFYAGYGTGVYKSTDGAVNWSDASVGLTPSGKYKLAIGRSDPRTLLLSADDGVFRTTDGGGTWASVLGRPGRAVAVDPADPLILYATQGYEFGQPGFLRSEDGGATWNPPSGAPTVEAGAWDVQIDPLRPNYVYAVLGNRVSRSIDRGFTFVPADNGIVLPSMIQIFHLAIDPSNTTTLYASGGDSGYVVRSTDSAASWSPIPFVPALGLTDLSVSSTGRTLYVATIGGIFQFERSFADVPDAAPIWPFVDAAAMNGLTAGCGDGMFCPGRTLTRAQAAVFLVKAEKGASFVPPAATGAVFADVSASSFAAAWIEELANEGVTAGCGSGLFCPSEEISRAQMAVLLLRAKHGTTFVPPPATGSVFGDVPSNAFAAAWIEELFHEGLAGGCGGGDFCPAATTTRGQAVTLLVGAFGLK